MLVCRVSLRLQANEVCPCSDYVVRGGPSVTTANTLTRNRALAEHVAAIRQRGKRMISDAIEIGRRLKLLQGKSWAMGGGFCVWMSNSAGQIERPSILCEFIHWRPSPRSFRICFRGFSGSSEFHVRSGGTTDPI